MVTKGTKYQKWDYKRIRDEILVNYENGFTIAECATVLGMSVGYCGYLIRQFRKRLHPLKSPMLIQDSIEWYEWIEDKLLKNYTYRQIALVLGINYQVLNRRFKKWKRTEGLNEVFTTER